jgi:homoserine O-succinyltransferase/O-acetyltransferase
MPVLMDRRRSRLMSAADAERRSALERRVSQSSGCVDIGLINNMPDAALQSTEGQFFRLLTAAAGDDILVRLRLYSLPDVPRTEFGRQHVAKHHSPIDDLWDGQLDGLVVTGREPQAADLRDEPYWAALTRTIDWAEDNTISSIWSCLVAHAALLHIDGIHRNPLGEKRFGLYECTKVSDHPLMDGLPARLPLPHSRWNDIHEDSLASHGYSILSRSQSGPDIFAKQRKSLFLFFQCHPEYDATALLLEYRRDIGRFLNGERDTYPPMPESYFDDEAMDVLAKFRQQALLQPHQDQLASFPTTVVAQNLTNTWQSTATRLYRNWLSYIVAHKTYATSDHVLATTAPDLKHAEVGTSPARAEFRADK